MMKFLGYVSKEHASQVNLRDLSTVLREKFGMKGGGSPTLIQGSGKESDEIQDAVVAWMSSK